MSPAGSPWGCLLMFVPMQWLRDYVDVPWSAHELAERLTASGSKVEGVQRYGADVTGVVAGRIVAIRPHPAADRLVVCDINIGDRNVQVVTGATNVAVDMLVPIALPGATVAGRSEPITAGDFRGVESYGMLCAEDELGISDDHSGIMALPPDTPVGSDLVRLMQLGDAVVEFEIYPNRPDCLSVVGIAREVAALTLGPLKLPEPAPLTEGESADQLAKVTVQAPELCLRYCARIIRGVRLGPSPLWMQQRLRAAGMRPINNVVDITNYVMLELGQPLHAFDLASLAGRHIIVRRAQAGEQMRTLDGQDRVLDADMLVIADEQRAVAIAGVMGGENSEVSTATVDLLLEAATFDQVSIRKTSRRLGLRTEASARFEKGLDPCLPLIAADRAAELFARICGGKVAPGVIDVHGELPAVSVVALRPTRVNAVLGTQMSAADMLRSLEALGFSCGNTDSANTAGELLIQVPTFRRDVVREIDLIEEVARIYGYDAIPPTLPQGSATRGGESRDARMLERVRTACIGAGLHEAITYSFTSPRHFDMLQIPPTDALRHAIRIANPLSEEQSIMRTTLAGNLLEALGRNAARQNSAVHLFELGSVFIPREWPVCGQPDERRTLGVAMMGAMPGQIGPRAAEVDFYALKGVLESIAATLGLHLQVVRGTHPSLHPGRTGRIQLAGAPVGFLGEVHPLVAKAFELPGKAYLMELDLTNVLPAAGPVPSFHQLPRFPAITRDLALLVPEALPAAAVEEIIRREAGQYLETLQLFDVYQGKQVPQGYRSLAYALAFRSSDRTLTDSEVHAAVNQVEQNLANEGVQIRR